MTRVYQGRHTGAVPLPVRQPGYHPWLPLALTALLLWLGFGTQPGLRSASGAPLLDQQTLTVPLNKSRILDLREPIARVSVANPAIADIKPINSKQIYINGMKLGATNMILWDDQDQIKRQIALEVTQDLDALKEKLYRVLPGERIKVESSTFVAKYRNGENVIVEVSTGCRTEDAAHPGVAQVQAEGDVCVAGPVERDAPRHLGGQFVEPGDQPGAAHRCGSFGVAAGRRHRLQAQPARQSLAK